MKVKEDEIMWPGMTRRKPKGPEVCGAVSLSELRP